MKYCTSCFYPHTKPDLWFDERGKCSACLAFEARQHKDWGEWETKFVSLIEKNRRHDIYDCIVPVSGGKDSHYQIIKVLEYGLNPLAVCAKTDLLSSVGRKNLDNIGELGVDLIEVNTNRKIRRKIARYGLETVGDISWGEHVTIFTIPFIIACEKGIPLIIYGENPQNEYGAGPAGTEQVLELGYEWLQEFGGLNGLRVSDLVEAGIAQEKDLHYYKMPDELDLYNVNPKAIFLGQFFNWNGYNNARIAKEYGFKEHDCRVEGTSVKYENLDNYQTGIHDYMKYCKFGFGRSTDIQNNLLRRSIVTKQEAKDNILACDGQPPMTYLDKPLDEILSDIDMGTMKFVEIVRKFTNKDLFKIDANQMWPIPLFLEGLKNA